MTVVRRTLLSSVLLSFALVGWSPSSAAAATVDSTAATLQRRTQELMNAVTSGSAAVWDRNLDDKARITDEGGAVHSKAEMVQSIKPLAAGVSGTIEVIDFSATISGNVAIATYVSDEHENYHGQELHCQYRSTDTWVKHANGWRLLASQVLALRTDPPAATLAETEAESYVGRYELAPGIVYEVRRKGTALERQRTGRPAEPLLREARDVFFVPGNPRYRTLFQRDAQGRVIGFVERREAWDLVWKRLPN
jgi:ketosteroid isomerase-like protein